MKKKQLIFKKFYNILNRKNINNDHLQKFVNKISGHFAIIIFNSRKAFCVVDHVRSIPLFYHLNKNEIYISGNALDIFNLKSLKLKINNMQAALEIGMSGYTIGKKTLCSEIYQLQAGQLLLFDNKETIVRSILFL